MKQEHNNQIPESFYQTGNTESGKSHRGLYLTLIVLVILLVGVVSVMGLLNIQLFRRVQELSPDDHVFQIARISEPEPAVLPDSTPPRPESEDSLQINLHQTPVAIANIPQEGGLSLQDIYQKNIHGIVAVTTGGSSYSGMVISSSGYILTNSSILLGNSLVQVQLSDGTKLDARVVGTDSLSDLAVLDVDATDLTPVSFGHDEHLQPGDHVVSIGNPVGSTLPGTMLNGYIAAINRDLDVDGRNLHLLQTNIPQYNGNAGGPLFNCYGQVIGIHTITLGPLLSEDHPENISFAIPSSTVKEIVEQLLRRGSIPGRPSLGFQVEMVSAFDQLYYRVPAGLFITSVTRSKLPLQPGDILLRFAGQRVGDTDTLQQVLQQHEAGETVPIVIYRNGQQHELSRVLEEEK